MTQLDLQQKLERSQSALKTHIERIADLSNELDALKQQVNALAAEVSGIKYLVMEVSDDDYAQASRRCQLLMGEIANFKTPATDAIHWRLMDKCVSEFTRHFLQQIEIADLADDEKVSVAEVKAAVEHSVAAIRQPEEKDCE